MAISYFKKLHLHGQNLIFNKFQSKLKIVIEDSKLNRFLVSGLISKYNDNNNKISDDSMDTNKVYIKFMVSELETVKDIATKKINLRYDDMKTIILDGLRYNVNKFEINNQSRDFLIMEITKFRN
ncbi:MAG: hypothetical protein KA384_07950 [Leptotrichiaceae bacterium]|nr:hypothetical protein [Leptotrichiaceae bacterium]